MRSRGMLIVLLAVLALTALLPGLVVAGAPKAGGTLKYAMLRDPTGWDPHINQGQTTYTFMANIYESLLRYSLKGTLEPSLAVKWETPDPTTYILQLRRNVKFSIERILDPNTTATRSKEFSAVQSVTVLDPYTVKITLKKADASFLDLLAAAETMVVDKK